VFTLAYFLYTLTEFHSGSRSSKCNRMAGSAAFDHVNTSYHWSPTYRYAILPTATSATIGSWKSKLLLYILIASNTNEGSAEQILVGQRKTTQI
jgi:hypothetical protein